MLLVLTKRRILDSVCTASDEYNETELSNVLMKDIPLLAKKLRRLRKKICHWLEFYFRRPTLKLRS